MPLHQPAGRIVLGATRRVAGQRRRLDLRDRPRPRADVDPQGRRAGYRGGEATARIPRGRAAHPVRVAVRPNPQTVEALGLGVPREDVRIEPRLREQDWANFQDPADIAEQKRLRNEYGHFYYRFTHGESGSDVYDRVSTFLESLWRYIEAKPADSGSHPMSNQSLVIVTHGLTMRLFCMRWFHWSVEYFESLENPVNGGHVVLVRQPDRSTQWRRPSCSGTRPTSPPSESGPPGCGRQRYWPVGPPRRGRGRGQRTGHGRARASGGVARAAGRAASPAAARAAICCAKSAVWMPWNSPSSHPTSWACAMRSSASDGVVRAEWQRDPPSSSTSSGASPPRAP